MANYKTNRYSRLSRSIIWMAIYVFIVLLPLLLMIVGDAPPGTSYLWDFSIGLGVGAASLILMMAVLTARFAYITAPFGIDVLYYFHRLIAFLILVLVVVHPTMLLMLVYVVLVI